MSFKVAFLVVSAAFIFHVTPFQTCILLLGYGGFASLDQWLAARAKTKVLEGEIYGWTVDPDNPEMETKGDMARVKLPIKEQIVVTRVAELLRRIS